MRKSKAKPKDKITELSSFNTLPAKAFKRGQTALNLGHSTNLFANPKKRRLPFHLIMIIMAKKIIDLAHLNLQLKKSKFKTSGKLCLKTKVGPSKH
jgi:hypothetical protein